MNEATHLLADKLAAKAKELNTSFSLLICAFQVFHTNEELIGVPEKRTLLDAFISYALTRHIIQKLTLQAQEKLISPSIYEVHEGCKELEIIHHPHLEDLPDYKAFRHILQCIIKDEPVKRLHIKAVAMVTDVTFELRNRYKKATITEVILQYCKKELEAFCNLALMIETGFSEEDMLTVLRY